MGTCLSLSPSPSLFSLSHLSSSLPSFYHHHLFSTATGVLQLHHKSRDRNHRLVCSSSLIPTFKVKLHPETLVSSSPSLPHLLHPHPLLESLHPLGFFRNLVQFSFFTTILIPCYRFPWSGTRLSPIWNLNFFKRKIFSQLDHKYSFNFSKSRKLQLEKISNQENFKSRKVHLNKFQNSEKSVKIFRKRCIWRSRFSHTLPLFWLVWSEPMSLITMHTIITIMSKPFPNKEDFHHQSYSAYFDHHHPRQTSQRFQLRVQ